MGDHARKFAESHGWAGVVDRYAEVRRTGSFRGHRTGDGRAIVAVHDADGRKSYALSPRYDLRDHSPTGFEWGYAGSGPAQLALAMVAFATGDDGLAQASYQLFKDHVIARLDRDTAWSMPVADVAELVKAQV